MAPPSFLSRSARTILTLSPFSLISSSRPHLADVWFTVRRVLRGAHLVIFQLTKRQSLYGIYNNWTLSLQFCVWVSATLSDALFRLPKESWTRFLNGGGRGGSGKGEVKVLLFVYFFYFFLDATKTRHATIKMEIAASFADQLLYKCCRLIYSDINHHSRMTIHKTHTLCIVVPC